MESKVCQTKYPNNKNEHNQIRCHKTFPQAFFTNINTKASAAVKYSKKKTVHRLLSENLKDNFAKERWKGIKIAIKLAILGWSVGI